MGLKLAARPNSVIVPSVPGPITKPLPQYSLSINRRILTASSLFAMGIGLIALIGWMADVESLKSVFPGFATMKVNAAICLILSGTAILLLQLPGRVPRVMAAFAGVVVALGGLLVAIEYATGIDLRVDQLFWDQSGDRTVVTYLGRMSPVAALSLICFGCSLLMLALRRAESAARFFASLVLVVGFVGVLGYFFGAAALYAAGHYTAIALNTSIALIALAVAALCLRPNVGMVAMLHRAGISGTVARRFVPVAIAVPFFIGWMRMWGQRQGYFGTETGLAIYCLANIFTFIAFIRLNMGHLVRVERSLQESARRYEFLADAIPQIAWTAKPDGNLDYYNRAWYEYTGMTFEQTKDWGWKPILHPDDLAHCVERWTRSFTTGCSYEVEYRFKRARDGTYRWHLGRALPLRDANGAITQWVGTCTDIDDQKRFAEELENRVTERTRELAEARRRIQEVLDGATRVSVIAADTDGLITVFNKGAEQMLGYRAEEMVGKQTPAIIHVAAEVSAHGEELTKEFGKPISGYDVFVEYARQGRYDEREWTYVRKDGGTLPVRLAVTPTYGSDGEINGFLGVATDMTESKRAEAVFKLAKESAEAASRAKSEFLANMSHEIRTPMNGIIGMTELALDTQLNRTQREYLEMVKHSADSLLSLINDILDFSKIEAGKLSLEAISFDLRKSLEKALKTLGIRADRKGLELTCRVEPEVPSYVVGDPVRLRQIIINLVDNAIKFTETGEINLVVQKISSAYGRVALDFSVSDTGIGIPVDKQEAIFAAFSQADNSTTRSYGGTGLGLTISSRLVEQMGGRLTLESVPGSGSTFRFVANLESSPEQPVSPDQRAADLENLPVLIVDDNATNRRILREMLLSWRMAPVETASALEGLAELEKAAAQKTPFQLVLLDALMPEIDGFALAKEIRKRPALSPAALIMLSSAMRADEIACSEESGLTGYLTKPVTGSELLDAIMQVFQSPIEAPSTARPNEESPLNPISLSILITDDNAVNRSVAEGILTKHGHSVALAENGQEAVDLYQRQRFDLILMDVQMPTLDGFGATAAIRQLEKDGRRRMPIIAMTAHALAGDRERCLAAGMDGYIAKPINRQELLEIVLGFGSGGQNSRRKIAPDLSREDLLSRFDGDVELLQRVSKIFSDQTPAMITKLHGALAAHDAAVLKQTAHTLIGSLGALGADRAVDCARELEALAETRTFEPAEQILNELRNELDTLQSRLASV